MFSLSGPDHGRISAMPHKFFQKKQQERPVVPKGQYVPAARRQGGTNEKRRHTSKAAVRTQAKQRHTRKTKAAAGRKEFRRLGLPVCTAVRFRPAVFCMREPFPGRPVWTLWKRRAAWIRAFRLRRPACLPDGSLCDFLPCLQLSARIFSSSSCR